MIRKKQFDRLSGQITFSTWSLGIFTIILAVVSIFAGIYVSNILRSINSAKSEISDLANQTETTRTEIKKISESIKTETAKAYEIFKRLEVNEAINHLQRKPEDIYLLEGLFAVSTLDGNDFLRLKNIALAHAWHSLECQIIMKVIVRRFATTLLDHPDLDERIALHNFNHPWSIQKIEIKRAILELTSISRYHEYSTPRQAKLISLFIRIGHSDFKEEFAYEIIHPFNSIVNVYNLVISLENSNFKNAFLFYLFKHHSIDLDRQDNADQIKKEIGYT